MLKAILFDFDGVLVDSYETTVAYFQETFRNFHLEEPHESKFHSLFGLKTIDFFKKLKPELTDKEIEAMFVVNQQLSLHYVPKIPLMPHALETLKKLHKTYKLGVVSSRGKESIGLLFEKHKLAKFFSVVIDREDITNHKPHPEGLLIASKKLGVNKKDAIYIGDTATDVTAAKNAGMPCVIVGKENPHGADYHIKHLGELPKLLATL